FLPTLTLANIAFANLTGGAANNTFDVGGWFGGGTLTGGGGGDVITATRDAPNFTLTNTSLTANDGLHLTPHGKVIANRAAVGDTFDASGWTSTGTLSGGGTGTVAATKNTDFTLTNAELATGDGMQMALAGIANARLTGGTGNNTFNVDGWTGGGT